MGVYTMSGARTGTLSPPTGSMRASLAEARSDLATIAREFSGDTASSRSAKAKPKKVSKP